MECSSMEVTTSTVIKTVKALCDFRKDRKETQMFDLLEKGKLTLNDSDVKYNKTVSAILVTQEALERAHCKEKYEILMSFYTSSAESKLIDEEPDFYHESLLALSHLSFRELVVLYHLDAYQKTTNHHSEIDYKPEEYIAEKTEIEIDDIYALFHKLLSSGLVIQCPILGGFVRVYTSPMFKRVKELISYDYHGDW